MSELRLLLQAIRKGTDTTDVIDLTTGDVAEPAFAY